jgi:hypothetical protein
MCLLRQRVLVTVKSAQFYLLGLIVVSVLVAQQSNAATGVAGQVGNVEIIGSGGGAPGNYDFRVFLTTGGVICNGQNWAYINTGTAGDANYSALVSSVLLAKSLGSTVTLYVNPVGSYCQLAYMVIN